MGEMTGWTIGGLHAVMCSVSFTWGGIPESPMILWLFGVRLFWIMTYDVVSYIKGNPGVFNPSHFLSEKTIPSLFELFPMSDFLSPLQFSAMQAEQEQLGTLTWT